MTINGGVTFTKTRDGNLEISHDLPIEEIDPSATLSDWIEWYLCNGWEWISPEEIGALTDAPIISDDAERDDHGKLIRVGRVYAHMRYALEDAAEELRVHGRVIFEGAGES
jgi:hypothetical protein